MLGRKTGPSCGADCIRLSPTENHSVARTDRLRPQRCLCLHACPCLFTPGVEGAVASEGPKPQRSPVRSPRAGLLGSRGGALDQPCASTVGPHPNENTDKETDKSGDGGDRTRYFRITLVSSRGMDRRAIRGQELDLLLQSCALPMSYIPMKKEIHRKISLWSGHEIQHDLLEIAQPGSGQIGPLECRHPLERPALEGVFCSTASGQTWCEAPPRDPASHAGTSNLVLICAFLILLDAYSDLPISSRNSITFLTRQSSPGET